MKEKNSWKINSKIGCLKFEISRQSNNYNEFNSQNKIIKINKQKAAVLIRYKLQLYKK
jgi:hypothetical protein